MSRRIRHGAALLGPALLLISPLFAVASCHLLSTHDDYVDSGAGGNSSTTVANGGTTSMGGMAGTGGGGGTCNSDEWNNGTCGNGAQACHGECAGDSETGICARGTTERECRKSFVCSDDLAGMAAGDHEILDAAYHNGLLYVAVRERRNGMMPVLRVAAFDASCKGLYVTQPTAKFNDMSGQIQADLAFNGLSIYLAFTSTSSFDNRLQNTCQIVRWPFDAGSPPEVADAGSANCEPNARIKLLAHSETGVTQLAILAEDSGMSNIYRYNRDQTGFTRTAGWRMKGGKIGDIAAPTSGQSVAMLFTGYAPECDTIAAEPVDAGGGVSAGYDLTTTMGECSYVGILSNFNSPDTNNTTFKELGFLALPIGPKLEFRASLDPTGKTVAIYIGNSTAGVVSRNGIFGTTFNGLAQASWYFGATAELSVADITLLGDTIALAGQMVGELKLTNLNDNAHMIANAPTLSPFGLALVKPDTVGEDVGWSLMLHPTTGSMPKLRGMAAKHENGVVDMTLFGDADKGVHVGDGLVPTGSFITQHGHQ